MRWKGTQYEAGKLDECNMVEFGTLDTSSENTIAILGHIWWPQTAKGTKGMRLSSHLHVIYGSNVMNAQLLELSLLYQEEERCSVSKGMRGQWPNKCRMQAKNKYPPLRPVLPRHGFCCALLFITYNLQPPMYNIFSMFYTASNISSSYGMWPTFRWNVSAEIVGNHQKPGRSDHDEVPPANSAPRGEPNLKFIGRFAVQGVLRINNRLPKCRA